MQLADGSFLITGGGSGLGAGCARRFVAAGARVVLLDVNQAAGAEVAQELGSAARFVAGDVSSHTDVSRAIQAAGGDFGPLRGAICCAGILGAARVVGRNGPHDLDLFSRVIQVNLVGTFNVLRLAAAAMTASEPLAEGQRGVLIVTASIAATEGQIGQVAYSASKAGVAGMVLPVARELAAFGIRCVAISPGVFATSMAQQIPEAARESLAAQVPFPPRFGDPDEYAALAQHIVENTMINGCTLRLDGAIRMSAK